MKFSPEDALELLKKLIEIPSFSKEEQGTFDLLKRTFNELNIPFESVGFNIISKNKYFNENKPNLLLNSHHDTVKPNKGYTNDPFKAFESKDKLFGLGSNDAGGCLVGLLYAFIHLYEEQNLDYNIIFIASAEEEVSGKNGISLALQKAPKIDLALIGEPTLFDLAISEKGLMVLDCIVKGKSGHAAREEGINAIYKAQKAIDFFRNFTFPAESKTLGPIKMSVTQIEAGTQHNVVPDYCKLVVDVRTTDYLSNTELLKHLQEKADFEIVARSTRLNPSKIDANHSLVLAAKKALSINGQFNGRVYGSPTLSDQALVEAPSLKIGPGDSARSHTADEFIFVHEVLDGCQNYLKILKTFFAL